VRIQLALDRLSRDECFQILSETKDHIDWIEVGTGVIKEYGMSIVRDIKEAYPDKKIVADMKTCDAGKHEAIQAFEAGADITTVMAFSADKTITDTLEVAKRYQKRIMIDLLGVTDKNRISELNDLGVDLVSLHFGKDMQQEGTFSESIFDLVNDFPGIEATVAGGINPDSLQDVLRYKPVAVIVGSAITKSEDSAGTASTMKGMIRQYEINH
jgi:3-hexulose-6-phosphate synthase